MKHLFVLPFILIALKVSAQDYLYIGPYSAGTNQGRISASGTSAEISINNRTVTSFVNSPTNGERWVIYNTGTTTDGKLRFWTGGDKVTFTKEGMVGIGTTTPGFPLQIRTPNETIDPISYGFDITRVNNGARGLSFGMATDNSYSVIGAHNADLRLGHTFNTGSGGQPIFHPDITIKHNDQNLGNVGIGTTNPSQRLDVNGNIALDNFQILSQGGSSIGFGSGGIGNEDDDITIDIANDGELELHRNGTNVFSIGNHILFDRTNTRNVGIGTTDPKSKLAVNGQIRATEVKVLTDVNSVPDYVFETDYDLRTLKETKEYITENKHLPEIPSASEIGENGIDLGDMNMRLLKKIEELTLHLIEQNERVEKLEKEVSTLKNK